MNISYNWLKEYIDVDLTPEQVGYALTSIGLETGSIEQIQPVKGGLEGLVIGKVLTCTNHPNSDHLHLTTVDVGGDEPLKIVCGAANVAANQKVVVATIGTTLYMDDKAIVIKRSKIRGEESFGMICAEDEIGIGTSHDGIIVLPDDVPVGTLAKNYYAIKDDYVLEVDLTPNRIDAASHYGVARDLSAYLTMQQSSVKLTRPSVNAFTVDNHDLPVGVTVENEEACPRYSGITLKGIKVTPSPDWLQTKLKNIGVRPINNVVDITNYLLHETGQPLHAFDADKITGQHIYVKTLPEGTSFVTLDGIERKLGKDDLMICDANGGMCIGGVFGGIESGVTDSTTNVFIESAYFNPVYIRQTARRHGLNTDASFRFERGCDPNNTLYVLKRAAMLVKELAGGTISSDIVDCYAKPIAPFKVSVHFDKINSLIGKEIDKETLTKIFGALEIGITEERTDGFELLVPTYRVDVQREVDVIEEILRIYGYNNVLPGESVHSSISYFKQPDNHQLQNLISEQLTANGFYEIMNNSLTKSGYYDTLKSFPSSKLVMMMNPLSSDLNCMRQTLLFGGLESIAYNSNRKSADLKFYEFGNCYFHDPQASQDKDLLNAYSEEMHLGLWVTGNKTYQNWVRGEEKSTFFELKAYVENTLRRLGISTHALQQKNVTGCDWLDEGMVYETAKGAVIAVLGTVAATIRKSFDIDNEVFVGDIYWDAVLAEIAKTKVSFSDLPKFPEVKRDLALLIDKAVQFAEIEKIAYETEKKLLKKVQLFDVYEGKNLPEGKKSYAVSFILQDASKTLTDKQIDDIMQRLIKKYEETLGAQLR
ncbi:phenylalanine--tRNA ligase subunit beta [Microbacter margulisiae]|uniref:Phenylalanine--tRNA ligase beta subunit n=1 Tax=Microbacter margulisiae TaxID=1350067 RepID=A0A7W5DR72_9PORP|nr:phenylalanine--tRNA ligase subunit beta [Microbacter margulisiae]MBB3187471.1 phenylalanyl-tRNA synthetase beta chain [Microbacter margulisiae]